MAVLAFTATLASPAVALAHGEVHDWTHGGATHRHEARGGDATDASRQPGASLLLAAVPDHDAELHGDCLGRIGGSAVAARVAARVGLTQWASVTRGPVVVPPQDVLSPLRRAAPPDQPRAPPLG